MPRFLRHYSGRLPQAFGDFDISADGSEILFDRLEEHSELALIERTQD